MNLEGLGRHHGRYDSVRKCGWRNGCLEEAKGFAHKWGSDQDEGSVNQLASVRR